MTGVLSSTTELTAAAARAVIGTLVDPDTLGVVASREVTPFAASASGIVLTLDGDHAGTLTVVVADEALIATDGSALRAAAEAAAQAMGSRVAGPPQLLDATLAVHAVLADPASTLVRIERGTTVVGVVASRVTEVVTPSTVSAGRSSLRDLDPQRLHLLRGVEMAVSVEIGRTRLTVGELLGLTPGAVVELDRPAGAPADLLVNGRLIGRGEVVVVDESFALRITDIVSADEER